MKCRLTCEANCKRSPQYPDGKMQEGTVIDHPDAWRIVRRGMAVPEDDECRERCGMNNAQIALAQKAHERLAAGIHPDDFDAYESGAMVGYNADGSWKPGPNYDDYAWQQRKANSPLIIEDE